jgi:ketosteroid isomerase-like protein
MTDLLQRLADEAAITRLLYAYCDAVDANRTDEIVALFTADAVFDLGYGRVYSGPAELARLFSQLDFYRATSHDLCSVVIDFDDDDDTARCRSHVYAFHLRADDGPPVHLWGRYADVVVRTGGSWAIARRQLRAAAELGAPPARGRPGRWEPMERGSGWSEHP